MKPNNLYYDMLENQAEREEQRMISLVTENATLKQTIEDYKYIEHALLMVIKELTKCRSCYYSGNPASSNCNGCAPENKCNNWRFNGRLLK